PGGVAQRSSVHAAIRGQGFQATRRTVRRHVRDLLFQRHRQRARTRAADHSGTAKPQLWSHAMIQVIDLIETDSLSETKDVWNEVSAFLGKQPGFSAGELFETFDAVHPCGDFKLTSFCCWAAEAGWRKARQAAKDDQRLAGVLRRSAAKFTSLITTLDRGDAYEAGSAGGHMVLIDVVSLDQPRMAAYAAMWTSAHKFMQNK